MTQPRFTFTDGEHGRHYSADEAERWLVHVLTDPKRAKTRWTELGQIDWWLLVLAVMVNPSLRDDVWNAMGHDGKPVLSDKLKFWIVLRSPENAGAAIELVRRVVHDVISACYVEEHMR